MHLKSFGFGGFDDYLLFFDLIVKNTIRIIKNMAVPKYIKKLLSGFGKKNKMESPKIIKIGMSVFVFIWVLISK
jgi:hypothetical protein